MDTNQLIQQNAQMRALTLALSPKSLKNLGNFSATGVNTAAGAGGGNVRVKLYNVGIGLKLYVEVVANITVGVHATALSGPQSPWNMVSRVRVTDYDGTDRINLSGYGMYLMNTKRRGSNYGLFRSHSEALTAAAAYTAPPFALPNLVEPDVLIAAATKNVRFFMEVPFAYSDNDLRGAVLMQTALGEMYLSLDFNNTFQAAAANVDTPFVVDTGSTVAVNSISVNVWQEYLPLQAIGGQSPLPQLDLLTVYELNEIRSTDNIAVSQEKLINFPNARSVLGTILYYVNNSGMTTGLGDITRFRQIVNGNNILYDANDRLQLFRQRLMFDNADLPASTYVWDYSSRPIETAVYGNVQLGVTPGAFTAGNTHIDVVWESMYTKGSVLPGMAQTS